MGGPGRTGWSLAVEGVWQRVQRVFDADQFMLYGTNSARRTGRAPSDLEARHFNPGDAPAPRGDYPEQVTGHAHLITHQWDPSRQREHEPGHGIPLTFRKIDLQGVR